MTEVHSAEDYRYYCDHGHFPKKTKKQIIKEIEVDDIYFDLLEKVKLGEAMFLPGNVASSKNSKEIQQVYTGRSSCCNAPYSKLSKGDYICTKCDSTTTLGKRPVLGHSKVVKKYIEDSEQEYVKNRSIFLSWKLDYPAWLGIYYIRDSLRRFDGINASQIIFDLFVKNNYVEDDNMDVFRHVDLGYHKDINRPGVIIVPLINFKDKRIELWR